MNVSATTRPNTSQDKWNDEERSIMSVHSKKTSTHSHHDPSITKLERIWELWRIIQPIRTCSAFCNISASNWWFISTLRSDLSVELPARSDLESFTDSADANSSGMRLPIEWKGIGRFNNKLTVGTRSICYRGMIESVASRRVSSRVIEVSSRVSRLQQPNICVDDWILHGMTDM
jgi:hypothetical protein